MSDRDVTFDPKIIVKMSECQYKWANVEYFYLKFNFYILHSTSCDLAETNRPLLKSDYF